MSLEKIEAIVLEVLKEVQELSGRKWEGIPVTNKPIGDLDGFDSLCSIEATALVEQRLGGAPLGPFSLFISEDNKRALNVQEISQRIEQLVAAQQGKR